MPCEWGLIKSFQGSRYKFNYRVQGAFKNINATKSVSRYERVINETITIA